jgi:hypothetical protein
MEKYLRNDYTLIIRLKRLASKKLKQEKNMGLFDKRIPQVFRIRMNINNLIEEIEEDMRQRALYELSRSSDWKKEYECIFK